VPSSQALPGYLITAPPSVCVPAVIGMLAVWIQKPRGKQKKGLQTKNRVKYCRKSNVCTLKSCHKSNVCHLPTLTGSLCGCKLKDIQFWVRIIFALRESDYIGWRHNMLDVSFELRSLDSGENKHKIGRPKFKVFIY